VFTRLVTNKMEQELKQPFVVEDRPGAGGHLAVVAALQAPADGYTILFSIDTTFTVNPSLFKQIPFDPDKDFIPISVLAKFGQALGVQPSLPVNSVKELQALSLQRDLNYGSAGIGSPSHLSFAYLQAVTGIRATHIPYRGGGPAVIDLVAGQVQFMFATAASVIPHVKSNRLRALAVTSLKRSPSLPELPTVDEAGVPKFEAVTWHGVVVPAATPRPLVLKINAEINQVLALAEVREKLAVQGIEAQGGTPAEFAAFLKSEIPKWTKVVRDSGAKPE